MTLEHINLSTIKRDNFSIITLSNKNNFYELKKFAELGEELNILLGDIKVEENYIMERNYDLKEIELFIKVNHDKVSIKKIDRLFKKYNKYI